MTAIETSRLGELQITISREHSAAIQSAENLLTHAIACGEALLEAKPLVPPGSWVRWLTENESTFGFSLRAAYRYMRIAAHKEDVYDLPTMDAADRLIGDTKSASIKTSPWHTRLNDIREQAVEMSRTTEMTNVEIAAALNVSKSSVHQWVSGKHDEYYERQKTRRNALKVLNRAKERERIVRMAGVSEAYSQLRKLAQSLDHLYRNGANTEIRAAAGTALKHVHKAEDEFIKALRSAA